MHLLDGTGLLTTRIMTAPFRGREVPTRATAAGRGPLDRSSSAQLAKNELFPSQLASIISMS
jgi:hypothetical protein